MGGVEGSGKAKRPIGVKFEIPYFTTSGIQVRYLKIIEPKVSAARKFSPCRLQVFDTPTASIPIAAVGALHHSIGRHCCPFAGCAGLRGLLMDKCGIDEAARCEGAL